MKEGKTPPTEEELQEKMNKEREAEYEKKLKQYKDKAGTKRSSDETIKKVIEVTNAHEKKLEEFKNDT